MRLKTKLYDKRDDFNLPIVDLSFICNIPATPPYGIPVYLFQLIQYSRVCDSYNYFLDKGLQLTRKLLNQGFLVVKLKSSFRKFYDRRNDLTNRFITEYLCHNPVLSTFMTYYSVCNKSNTMDATCAAGNVYPPRAPELTPVFNGGLVVRSRLMCSVLYIIIYYFSIDHCIICPSSIYDFWLPLWNLQFFLVECVCSFMFCENSNIFLFMYVWIAQVIYIFISSSFEISSNRIFWIILQILFAAGCTVIPQGVQIFISTDMNIDNL